jgi:hypothetical protein
MDPSAQHLAGNLTLAVMRPEDFGGTFSSNAMQTTGVRFVSDTFDSGVCWQAICVDPDGNPLSLHHRYAPKEERPASAADPPPANPEDRGPR